MSYLTCTSEGGGGGGLTFLNGWVGGPSREREGRFINWVLMSCCLSFCDRMAGHNLAYGGFGEGIYELSLLSSNGGARQLLMSVLHIHRWHRHTYWLMRSLSLTKIGHHPLSLPGGKREAELTPLWSILPLHVPAPFRAFVTLGMEKGRREDFLGNCKIFLTGAVNHFPIDANLPSDIARGGGGERTLSIVC